MGKTTTFNIYCDESCHLEHDRIPIMAWGAVTCEKRFAGDLSGRVRRLKTEYGLKTNFEAKWTKISPAKTDFYLALINFFLTDDRLRFRGLVVPNKERLDHLRFDQSHDDWYYKMYFTMLRTVFKPSQRYRIYLDLKDTRGGPKTRKLHEILANSLHDFGHEYVESVQQIRSHESEILQISDLLIGALTYANRGLAGNQGKVAVIKQLREQLGEDALTRTSPLASFKFNVMVWRAQDPIK